MKNVRFKNSKRAFTIIELVIVIAVISILAAVLIPTFASMIRKAKDARLEAELNGKEKENIAESVLGSDGTTTEEPERSSTPILSYNGFAMQVIRLPDQDTEDAYAFKFKFGITKERVSELRKEFDDKKDSLESVGAVDTYEGTFSIAYLGFGSQWVGEGPFNNIFSSALSEFIYNPNSYYWVEYSILNAESKTVMIKKNRLLETIESVDAPFEDMPENAVSDNIYVLPITADVAALQFNENLIKFDILFYYNENAENPEFIFCTPEILLEHNRAQGNID
ncbi:MAG: type II secretion system protein [Clostridia bacterium]|nr:type II secretion system protein [Clostridia bacterium]